MLETTKNLIGRREKVDFPELDLYEIDAKIDTGAFTSSIHCHNIMVKGEGEQRMVTFNLLDPSHPAYDEREYTLPVFDEKHIKNSFGQSEHRYIIKTTIQIYDDVFPIELSLADRSNMEVPVLLGRKLLRRRFLVDVQKKNLSYKHKIRKNKKTNNK